MLKRIYKFFFPTITYEWCAVRPIFQTGWVIEQRKCKNGKPVGTGYFLEIVKGQNRDAVVDFVEELKV